MLSNQVTNSEKKELRDEKWNEKFSGLMSAIEFFTQKFDSEHIIEYAYEFADNLIEAEKLALWYHKDEEYVLLKNRGYKELKFSFKYEERYNQIVYFHAGLLYKEHMKHYFPKALIDVYDSDIALPLIMDKKLYGIIFITIGEGKTFKEEDEMVANALMNLFTVSLTNYHAYENLERAKLNLDEKIFNLFAINQSTKALLSERSIENLYELSIGVFSELTQSSVTAFFIHDPKSENFILKSCKNVFKKYKVPLKMILFANQNDMPASLPVLIDMKNKEQRNAFERLFFNGTDLVEKINPYYVVNLMKENKLVGFVTLGEKVNDREYEKGVFELIESLASATYIAINNAMHVQEIQTQKGIINRKLDELIRLNALMKNINSADNADNLINLVMTTMAVNFEVKNGFFAFYNKSNNIFQVKEGINLNTDFSFPINEDLMNLLDGEAVIIYREEDVREILQLNSDLNDINVGGVILFPVYIDDIEINLLGVIGILNTGDSVLMSEENLIKFESIANHMAPVLYQLQYVEKVKQHYEPNYRNNFISELKKQIQEAEEFSLDLFVIHIEYREKNLFQELPILETLKEQYHQVFPINGTDVMIIVNTIDEYQEVKDSIPEDLYNMNIYKFMEDFKTSQEFIESL